MTTDQRLIDYTRDPQDPGLEALVAQYGRYLSCPARATSSPQSSGLWNQSNTPPWNADYHTNINVEMNYWSAEVGTSPKPISPYSTLTEALEELSAKATAAEPTIAMASPSTAGPCAPATTFSATKATSG